MVIFLNNAFKKKIDELGRIVIPKQIREDFKINNYDELDIYMKEDNIVIKKNIGIYQYKEKFDRFLSFLKNKISFSFIITDKNKIISSNYNIIEVSLNKLINDMEYNKVVFFNGLYLLKTSIIIDSNYLGDIIFVNNNQYDKEFSEIKDIKNILLDLIK